MARASKTSNGSRRRHSEEFKAEALALADRIGASAAGKELGIHDSQFDGWRGKARLRQDRNAADDQLVAENARLKRQLAEQAEELAILKKAAAYFAKSLT